MTECSGTRKSFSVDIYGCAVDIGGSEITKKIDSDNHYFGAELLHLEIWKCLQRSIRNNSAG